MKQQIPAVRLERISRSFSEGNRERCVLRELDLSIAAGEIVALRGRSGSGKSTLLNLISGIDVADSGVIEVAGKDLINMRERDWTLFRRAQIGFVYQAFNLVPTLTVADNVRLVLELNGISRKDADIRVTHLLEIVNL
ncbi:MAG: ATP-binding cassette domain-containing protein, partial [Woeseia sp.]|nr:ATP-binding cassette domain-containing protein [Woeseia sp.]